MKGKKETSPFINEQIRATTVQLITQDGVNVGILPKNKALGMAGEAGLDLVLIAERGKEGVAVVKIMDFGKVLYEKKKKRVEAKKHQKDGQVKEFKLRHTRDEHDYQTTIKQKNQIVTARKTHRITLAI